MELGEIWQEFGLDEIEEILITMFPQAELSLKELMGMLLKGDLWGVIREIFSAWSGSFSGSLSGMKGLLITLLVLGVISAALVHFSDIFDKYHVGELSFYFTYLLQTALLLHCFSEMMETARMALDNIVLFVKLLMPAYLLTVGIATGSVTAGLGYQIFLFLVYGVEEILAGGFLPMVTCLMLLSVLEGIQERLEYLISLITKVVGWGLKGALGAVAGVHFLQTLLGPALDSIKGSAFQRIISSIPGIGNGAESVLQLAVGSAVVIKNSIGVLLLLFLLVMCLTPLMKLFFAAILLKVAAALLVIVCDRRMAKNLDRAGENILLLLRITGTAMLFFLITIAMTAASIKR